MVALYQQDMLAIQLHISIFHRAFDATSAPVVRMQEIAS